MKVTSRGRPTELLKCVETYINLAADPTAMVWLFTFDQDDRHVKDLEFKIKLLDLVGPADVRFGKSVNKIEAVNRDINSFIEPWHILLSISDDQLPVVQGYDNIIRNAMPNDLDASLWFFDGAQPRLNTQEILGRKYYERDGFVYDPRFKSFYCDNLATDLAAKRGKQIKSTQCIIKHFHPQCQGPTHMKWDYLYQQNNKYWDEDKAMYERIKNEL